MAFQRARFRPSHPGSPAPPLLSLPIRLSQEFDAAAAAAEMLEFGVTLVDDIAEHLYDVCQDELLDQLGHTADEMDIQVTRVDTSIGPVFIFRDRARVTLARAKQLVFAQRPEPA